MKQQVKFEDTGPVISEADIAKFENKHRVRLPELYRDFLLHINGGHPIPDGIRIAFENGVADWRIHYFFGLEDPVESCNLEWVTRLTSTSRSSGLIPIAGDEFGNFFYVETKASEMGSIYFGATPGANEKIKPIRIALDFQGFLDALVPLNFGSA